MDILLSEHEQVFLVMPAKAGGKSVKSFVDKCTPSKGDYGTMIMGKIGHTNKRETLMEDIQPPSLIFHWLSTSGPGKFVSLAKQTTKKSLIIYIHREDTDRLKSAIRHYVHKAARKNNWRNGIQEEVLLEVIEEGSSEIGNQGLKILTCEAYEAIEDNAPSLVFLHYLQVSKVFELLAKHHCPGQEPVHENSGSDKTPIPVILKNPANSTLQVYMDDWLDAKTNLLELGLNLKQGISCQAKTRKMEADLLSCPDETLHFSSSTFFRSA